MFVSNITASQIWASTTRTLTSLGSALSPAGASNQTLAASATFLFSAPSATLAFLSVGVIAGAAGTMVVSLQDGLNVFQILSVAAAGNGCAPCIAIQAGVGAQVKNNDGANSGKYTYALLVFQ